MKSIVIKKEFLNDFMNQYNMNNKEIAKREMLYIMANYIKTFIDSSLTVEDICDNVNLMFE